jgi:hypothetical protein
MRRRKASISGSESGSILDFDKVKEPVNAGKIGGKKLFDFGNEMWKNDRRNYR